MAKQFKYKEFWRILERVAGNNDSTYHCTPQTLQVIHNILYTDYPYQQDDIEYIMDVMNYHLRCQQYTGDKHRFPISKYLDQICKDDLYVVDFLTSEKNRSDKTNNK